MFLGVARLTAADVSPLHTRIDERIANSHVGPVAATAADEEFLRRIYLDLVGRIPSVTEARQFLGDADPERRQKLVGQLLASDECDRRLAIVFDLIWMERRADLYVTTAVWREYLRQSFAQNKPYHKLVAEILAADGEEQPHRAAAKFYLDRDVESHAVTRDVSRMFLGRDIRCAQCHDHPLVSDYLQAEYYGIHSFLTRSYRFDKAIDAQQKVALVAEKAEGESVFTSVFEPEIPAATAVPGLVDGLPFALEDWPNPDLAYLVAPADNVRPVPRVSRRAQLAERLTDRQSVYFNRNAANRLWRVLMKQGVVEPPDMLHPDNPAIYPLLLDELADGLVELNYDVKGFLREVALSQAYQRSMTLPTDLTQHAEQAERDRPAWMARQQFQLEAEQQARAELVRVNQELTTFERDLVKVRTELQQTLATRAAQLKTRAEHETKLTQLREALAQSNNQATALATAATQASLAASAATTDTELAASAQLLVGRSEQANQQRDQIQRELDQVTAAWTQANNELTENDRQLNAHRERHEQLAVRVVERGGALRAMFRYHQLEQSRRLDLEHRLDLSEQLLKLRAAEAALAAAEAAPQAESADNAAQRTEVEQARAAIRRELERRFVVAGIQGLSPEQLALSLIQGLGLMPRLRAEATAEWQTQHKDAKPEELDAARRETEIVALTEARRDRITASFVTLFGGSPGSPQDTFQATVDQALFFGNDGEVQGWVAPQQGNLSERLLAIDDPGALVDELMLSLFTRQPTSSEREATIAYLNQTAAGAERRAVVEEMVWSLLTSVEFRFNH